MTNSLPFQKTVNLGLGIILACLFVLLPAKAEISGSAGNEPVHDMGWPAGSLEVANLKSRVAFWEGPPFGGGQHTFEYRGEATEDFQKALDLFAKIESEKKELIIQSGVRKSFWLGIMAKDDPELNVRVDWAFEVWNQKVWDQLFNNPESDLLSDSPNFRQPVSPPRLLVFLGEGVVKWDEVKVPEGVIVIDQRGKEGVRPSVKGIITDMTTGAPISGAKVTLVPGTQKVEGALPEATTGEDGLYILKDVPEGGFYVLATREEYAPKRSLSFVELHGSDVREEALVLAKSVPLSGVVRGPEGEVLAGARVIALNVLGSDGFGYDGPEILEVKSGEDGSFALVGLPQGGHCRLTVWIDGFYLPGSVTTKYELSGKEPLALKMIGTGSIRGVLKRSGEGQMDVSLHPPGGNQIGSWGGGMHCKEDGSFEFKNVPVGEYLIGPNQGDDFKEGDPGVQKIAVERDKLTEVMIAD